MKFQGLMTRQIVNLIRISLISASLPLLQGCGSDVEWSDSVTIPSQGWSPLNIVQFALEQEDSLLWQTKSGEPLRQPVTATLYIRYTDRCDIARLPILIQSESLDSEARCDTVLITLFNPDGSPAIAPEASNRLARKYNLKSHPLQLGVYDRGYIISSGQPLEPMARYTLMSLADSTIEGITHLTLSISR